MEENSTVSRVKTAKHLREVRIDSISEVARTENVETNLVVAYLKAHPRFAEVEDAT